MIILITFGAILITISIGASVYTIVRRRAILDEDKVAKFAAIILGSLLVGAALFLTGVLFEWK